MSRKAVSTLVIDQGTLFREGLTRLLNGSRFRVTHSCCRLENLPQTLTNDDGECVLLIGLSEASPAFLSEAVPAFKRQHVQSRVIVLSDHYCAEELLTSLEAGVDGYLSKQISSETLLKYLDLSLGGETIVPYVFLKAIIKSQNKGFEQSSRDPVSQPVASHSPANAADLRQVERGLEPPLAQTEHPSELTVWPPPAPAPEPEIARHQESSSKPLADSLVHLPDHAADDAMNFSRGHRLSSKEEQILHWLTQGASNKEIARQLGIAEATVKVHIKAILRKAGVQNRTQAAMWAVTQFRTAAE